MSNCVRCCAVRFKSANGDRIRTQRYDVIHTIQWMHCACTEECDTVHRSESIAVCSESRSQIVFFAHLFVRHHQNFDANRMDRSMKCYLLQCFLNKAYRIVSYRIVCVYVFVIKLKAIGILTLPIVDKNRLSRRLRMRTIKN